MSSRVNLIWSGTHTFKSFIENINASSYLYSIKEILVKAKLKISVAKDENIKEEAV